MGPGPGLLVALLGTLRSDKSACSMGTGNEAGYVKTNTEAVRNMDSWAVGAESLTQEARDLRATVCAVLGLWFCGGDGLVLWLGTVLADVLQESSRSWPR